MIYLFVPSKYCCLPNKGVRFYTMSALCHVRFIPCPLYAMSALEESATVLARFFIINSKSLKVVRK